MATFKCKYCDSDDELHFEQPYKKGNRPVRALDGQNHKCKQNANPQIGETKKKVWKNDRTQFIYNREGKFKFGCDAPKEKTPTFRLCGNCKDGTEVFQYLSEEACQCKLLGFHTQTIRLSYMSKLLPYLSKTSKYNLYNQQKTRLF